MGRRHLTPKKHLGREVDRKSQAVSAQLSRIANEAGRAAAAAQASAPPAPAGEPYFDAGAEASIMEDLAVYQGADVLFSAKREGPITALAIILIPEENRENRRIAALAANFGFVAYLNKRKRVAVAVPAGYVTDFASIPGFAQWMISPFGRHSEAAVVHDWLYTLGTPGDAKGRKLADMTFRRALQLVGVGWLRRSIMYRSVRLGGKSGYGLPSDYDFRDLVELKRRDPLPDRNTFAYTMKEWDLPKPGRQRSAKKDRRRACHSAPGRGARSRYTRGSKGRSAGNHGRDRDTVGRAGTWDTTRYIRVSRSFRHVAHVRTPRGPSSGPLPC